MGVDDFIVEVDTGTGLVELLNLDYEDAVEVTADTISVIEVVPDDNPLIELVEAGPPGPPGPPGTGFTHSQTNPAAQWTVTHNLNRRVVPTLVLTANPSEPVNTDVVFIDNNSLYVQWSQPETGWAYL